MGSPKSDDRSGWREDAAAAVRKGATQKMMTEKKRPKRSRRKRPLASLPSCTGCHKRCRETEKITDVREIRARKGVLLNG